MHKLISIMFVLLVGCGLACGQGVPALSGQPQSQTVTAGQVVTFSVSATGATNYYWYKNAVLVPEATGPSYTFTTRASDTGAQFYVLLRNAVGNTLSSTAILSVTPRTDLATVQDVENFGTVPASQPANGFGLNVSASADWQFSACQSIGCKWVRFDCPWNTVEIQNIPSNTSGGYSLAGNPACASGLASTHAYGLNVNLEAYWGPPSTPIAVGITSADIPIGSTKITISSLLSGSLANATPSQTTLTTNVGVGTPTPVALYEGGALVVGISEQTLTLAKATDKDLPAGTKITVSALLYPPVMFPATDTGLAYLSNRSLQAFDGYMHYLATAIASTGNTGTVELWNEPETNAECWDYGPNCYDNPPAHFAVQEGSGIALILSAMSVPSVAGVKYANGWTDTNGSQSIYNPVYAPYFSGTVAQANEAYGYESFHTYGNMPEQMNWIPQCLQANSNSSGQNISFACTPIGGDSGSNFKYAASYGLYPQAQGGLHQAITETGVCRGCLTQTPTETAIARFDLRQFIVSQANGISPVIYYRASDDPSFLWFQDSATPMPVAKAFKGFIADLDTISNAPVGTYANSMPQVSSYTGYYPLATASFVGTKSGATANSIMYLSWQKTYTVPPAGGDGSSPPWFTLASPGAVNESISVPAGYAVATVKDLITQANVQYVLLSGTLTFPVSDNPIEVLLSPTSVLSPQTIAFSALPNVQMGVLPTTLHASASSGLTVSYSVSGPATLSGPTLTITGAGTVTVTANQSGSSVYAPAPSVSVSFSVGKATPSITWPTPANIAYGTAISATQLDATSTIPGTMTYSPGAGTTLKAGTYVLSCTFTPTDLNDYTTATTSVTISVGQATPVVTWTVPARVTYGTALSATQLNASSATPGTFTYIPVLKTVLPAGSQTLGVVFTPTDTTDFSSTTASVTISVGQAIPTIVWPAPAAIGYGAPLSGTQLDATSSTPGVFTYSPGVGSVLSMGAHSLTATFTPVDTTNYAIATASVPISVGQATPVITWTAPAAVGYGTALSATQLNATSNFPGVFTYSPTAGTVLPAGSHTLTATFTPTDSKDFTSSSYSVMISVRQATPVITWSTPASIAYGTAVSAMQLDATSTVPGVFSYSATVGTVFSPGTHLLTATYTPSDQTSYTSASASVSLLVAKQTPLINWPVSTIPIPLGTQLLGVQLDATSPVAGTFSYSPAVGTILTAGTHTVTAVFTPSDANTYTSATASVTISVGRATPVITWPAPAAISYGTALTAVQLDAMSATPGTFSYSPAAGVVLAAGTHTLVVTFTPTDANSYNTVSSSAAISVGRALPLIVWPTPAPISYGSHLSALQLNATSTTPGTFTYSAASGIVLPAGSQTITATFTPTDATDYATATASVAISVGRATPVVSWSAPMVVIYGTPLSNSQLDASSKSVGTFTYSPAAGSVLSPGFHILTVVFTPTDSTDYNVVTVTRTILVQKRRTTVDLASTSTVATPTQNVTLTATVEGQGAETPTGAVTILDGSSPIETITLDNQSATYSLASLSPGNHTLTALYSGDADYYPSTASTAVFAVAHDFTISSAGPGTETLAAEASTSIGFSLQPILGSYPDDVSFSVSGLPSGTQYSMTPSIVLSNAGAMMVALRVKTASLTGQNTAPANQKASGKGVASILFSLLLLPATRLRRLKQARIASPIATLVLLTAGLGAFTGCGTDYAVLSQHSKQYKVTVTATSGRVQHAAAAILNGD